MAAAAEVEGAGIAAAEVALAEIYAAAGLWTGILGSLAGTSAASDAGTVAVAAAAFETVPVEFEV